MKALSPALILTQPSGRPILRLRSNMDAIAKLTPRRQRFADEYVLCGSGAEAARRAGYSEKTKPDVLSAIQALKAQNAAAFDVTRQDVIGGVLEAIAMARLAGDPGAMLTGLRDLSRMMGFNEPEAVRVAVAGSGAAALAAKFVAMSDAELIALAGGTV